MVLVQLDGSVSAEFQQASKADKIAFIAAFALAARKTPELRTSAITDYVARAVAVRDSEEEVRAAAQQALAQVARVSPALATQTLNSVRHAAGEQASEAERIALHKTLQAVLKAAPEVSEAELVRWITGQAAADAELEVRREAQRTLGVALHARRQLAAEAFAVVEGLWSDPDRPYVRKAAQRTLAKIVELCPDLASQALAFALTASEDAHRETRRAAQQTIRMIVDQAPDLADGELVRRVATIAMVDEVGEVADAAREALAAMLVIKDEWRTRQPERIARRFEGAAVACHVACEHALDTAARAHTSGDPYDHRIHSLWVFDLLIQENPEFVISHLGTTPDPAAEPNGDLIDVTRQVLETDPNWMARRWAARTLGAVGAINQDLARLALPHLRTAEQLDHDELVRKEATTLARDLVQRYPDLALIGVEGRPLQQLTRTMLALAAAPAEAGGDQPAKPPGLFQQLAGLFGGKGKKAASEG